MPALSLQLEHESMQEEAGQQRTARATVKAVALGAMAERLQQQALGTAWCFNGFLMSPRGGRHLVFHIQEFHPV